MVAFLTPGLGMGSRAWATSLAPFLWFIWRHGLSKLLRPPASASQSAGIAGLCHSAQLALAVYFATELRQKWGERIVPSRETVGISMRLCFNVLWGNLRPPLPCQDTSPSPFTNAYVSVQPEHGRKSHICIPPSKMLPKCCDLSLKVNIHISQVVMDKEGNIWPDFWAVILKFWECFYCGHDDEDWEGWDVSRGPSSHLQQIQGNQ